MTTVQFPSAQFPGYLALGLEAPDRWEALPQVGLPLALVRDAPEGDFRPNVIAVLSRFGPQHTLEQAIAEVTGRLEPLPDYSEIGRERAEQLGHPGFRIEGVYSDGRGGTLLQSVRLLLVDRGPVRDLVQLTGSCSGDQLEVVLGEIRAIQDSLSVTE